MAFARSRNARTIALLGAASAIGLGLAGCKLDNRPLLARGEPAPAYAAAPADGVYPYALGPIDPAEPARVVPVAQPYDGYELAERAYAYDRVAWQAPPDYGFRYDDLEPWAWQTAGDELMFAEPLDDGYRFYYYEPGEDYPYFVRDPQYGYAYGDGGVLSAVFSAAGALLGSDQLYRLSGVGGAYLNRGYDMRRTYYAEPRYALASDPVWYDRWEDRYPVMRSSWQPWMAAADRTETWRTYRISTGERELHRFDRERERRARDIEKMERKWAKADDKAWRKAEKDHRKDERRFAAAPPPQRFDGRHEDRHGRDDHRGRGRGHDPEHAGGRAVPAAAVIADNRGSDRFRGGDDRGGRAEKARHDDGPRGHGGGKGPDKGHGGGKGHGGDKGGGKGRD
ncbi:hypothetical protein [Phenylobacterium sp. J367]|uniref:hypothetical protein n=1 Tax=Phenylobacterium sp. J367 TaxID=2898435 RepID=UPI0021512E49|nr:hypothetical protein [Phenylobacterium sp. J367]MCR5877844.1 hypothetical protein [Phenylobacterium sp. J367]